MSLSQAHKVVTAGATDSPNGAPTLSLPAIVVLSVGFRLTAMFLIRYGGAAPDFSDFRYYHELASLSAQGFFPGVQYWSEYPPIFPWIAVAAYRLTLSFPTWIQPYFWFDLFLTVVLAVADAGCVIAIDRIGDAMGGKGWGRRSAVMYVALFTPAFAVLGWFDSLPTFFLLVALAAIVCSPTKASGVGGIRSSWRSLDPGRWVVAGLAIGLGVMVKLFPVVALPATLVISGGRGRERTTVNAFGPLILTLAFVLAACCVLALPFLIGSPETFLATFRNVTARGSWESPWALLDGYYGTGGVASLADRLYFTASASWGTPVRYPMVWWLIALIVAALYLARLRVAIRVGTPLAAVSIVAFGTTLLLLMSRGFSQQFIVWLMPFVVLMLPGLTGALLAVILALDTLVLEGYLYVGLFPSQHRLLWVSVAVRTMILLWLALECAMRIDPVEFERFATVRRRIARPILGLSIPIAIVIVALIGPSVVAEARVRSGDATIQDIVSKLPPSTAIVVTQPALYERLAGSVGGRPMTLVAEPRLLTWTGDRSLNSRLESALADSAIVVDMSDASQPTTPVRDAVEKWLLARFGPATDQSLGPLRMSEYDQTRRPTERPLDLRFGDGPHLVGISPGSLTTRSGSSISVSLHWRADRAIGKDYTVSAQILDQQGKLVVQHDAMPADNTLPMTGWRPGDNVFDPVALTLPANVRPGTYSLLVAVYDHQSLRRLDVTGPGSAQDHANVASVDVTP